ncbi:MAG: flagellar hook capping FlgD N-terminal domain-containing protein [Cypionkella sp.]|nr:flagellar hook capping FlgD N-terminal domain-containing protein [Cypionkella sp.]
MQTALSTAPKSAISSDFTTFLKMLTTQIKNQDPTNPMDSADFAVQLATFSGVEQQVKTNDMLSTLSSQFGVMGMSQLAAWVGQEARAPSPVYLGNSDVTISYATATGADSAVLAVRDAQGNLVAREDVPLGTGPYQWSGFDATGAPLPNGIYSLSIESFRNGQQVGEPSAVQAYSPIQEARSGPTGTVLVLAGGIEVAATDVSALRVAGTIAPATNSESGNGSDSGGNTQGETGTNTPDTAPEQGSGGDIHAGVDDAPVISDAPPVTLDEFSQPIPETYTPD